MGHLYDGEQQLNADIRIPAAGMLEITLSNLTFHDLHEIQLVVQIPGMAVKTHLAPLHLAGSDRRAYCAFYTCPAESSGQVVVMFTDSQRKARVLFVPLAVPRATEATLAAEALWDIQIYPQLTYHWDLPIAAAQIQGYRAGLLAVGLQEIRVGRFVSLSPVACIDILASQAVIRVAGGSDADLAPWKRRLPIVAESFGTSHTSKAFRLGCEFVTLLDMFLLEEHAVSAVIRQIAQIQMLLADFSEVSPAVVGRLNEISALLNPITPQASIRDLSPQSRLLSIQYLEELETHFFAH